MNRVAFSSIPLILMAVVAASLRPQVSAASPYQSIKQLRLSWAGDPRTTMSVVWQDENFNSTSYVEYGVRSQNLDLRAEATSSHYRYETGTVRESTLTGLKPDTVYHYRVVGDSADVITDIRSFRTAPAKETPFTCTAYGDQGVSPEAHEIVHRVAGEKPAFHLHLGDLAYANGKQAVWDNWLELITPLACRVPYMPTLGNHENEKINGVPIGYVSYLARFALPRPKTHYTFDYSNARFVAFNSDSAANGAQLNWLRQTLAAARAEAKIRWVIVYQHHPLYSSTIKREDDLVRVGFEERILDEYKVDLLLSGHHHNYERSLPLRAGVVQSTEAGRVNQGVGTIHVTSGGGGKGLYDFIPARPARTAVREKTHNYLRLRVDSRTLNVTALRRDGSVIDEFKIEARAG